MKYSILITSVILLLTSCSNDDSNQSIITRLQQEWHFTSFFGAEGPQCDFNRGDMIYTFSVSELHVEDNYLEDDICSEIWYQGGTYDYEVRTIDGTEFLFVDDREEGRISFVDNDLLIESWVKSSGDIIDDAPTFRLVL